MNIPCYEGDHYDDLAGGSGWKGKEAGIPFRNKSRNDAKSSDRVGAERGPRIPQILQLLVVTAGGHDGKESCNGDGQNRNSVPSMLPLAHIVLG